MFDIKSMNIIVVALLLGIFNYSSAQTSQVSWSTFSMGYGAPNSETTLVKTVLGQSFVGQQKSSSSEITVGFLAGVLKPNSTTIYALVYAGDANNDGLVDARDILPIGRFFNNSGYPRTNASLQWSPPQTVQIWEPYDASFADCNGNGTIQADDVMGIIQNWHKEVGSLENPIVNRVELCKDLLVFVDEQQPLTPAMKEIRTAVVNYMKNNLGISFDFSLLQNYPNPFNPSTTIRFNLSENVSRVKIIIYDINGQNIWEKTLEEVPAGEHEIIWNGVAANGGSVASGVYFYRIFAGDNIAVKRMMLLK